VCNDDGLAIFDLIRGHGSNGRAILCAFDPLEVNGDDVRGEPVESRKRRLAGLLRLQDDGIAVNETFSGEGDLQACLLARLRGASCGNNDSAHRIALFAAVSGSRSSCFPCDSVV
jgi:hypothetical protein